MGRITLQQAALWCGGRVDPKYKDVTFYGANNDSRKIEKDQLFIALQGARDGHDFIPSAFQKGAAAVLCTHCEEDYPAIIVEDTRVALGQIARGERDRIGMKVIGVTGSVGKSTTKEMVSMVLKTTYRVAKTPANHNNDIGMPMAILSVPEDTEVAVLEMGMNHFREMAYLSSIAKPDIAVIVNIGTMHIEHLGSMEGILRAKLEILEGMSDAGVLILNGDDALLWNQRNNLDKKTLYFGVHNAEAGVQGKDITQKGDSLSFGVMAEDQAFSVELLLKGEHYAQDALAAISVGIAMQVPVKKIQESLLAFRNMEGRQEIYKKNDMTIIQDYYNAGPESMNAALAVLGNYSGRRVAVLGEMLELGVCADAEHYKVGRAAAQKADVLLAYGPTSEHMLYGAITGGMSQNNARAFTDKEKLIEALKQIARPGDVLLFKGSRGMRMEQILGKFLDEEK